MSDVAVAVGWALFAIFFVAPIALAAIATLKIRRLMAPRRHLRAVRNCGCSVCRMLEVM